MNGILRAPDILLAYKVKIVWSASDFDLQISIKLYLKAVFFWSFVFSCVLSGRFSLLLIEICASVNAGESVRFHQYMIGIWKWPVKEVSLYTDVGFLLGTFLCGNNHRMYIKMYEYKCRCVGIYALYWCMYYTKHDLIKVICIRVGIQM